MLTHKCQTFLIFFFKFQPQESFNVFWSKRGKLTILKLPSPFQSKSDLFTEKNYAMFHSFIVNHHSTKQMHYTLHVGYFNRLSLNRFLKNNLPVFVHFWSFTSNLHKLNELPKRQHFMKAPSYIVWDMFYFFLLNNISLIFWIWFTDLS